MFNRSNGGKIIIFSRRCLKVPVTSVVNTLLPNLGACSLSRVVKTNILLNIPLSYEV